MQSIAAGLAHALASIFGPRLDSFFACLAIFAFDSNTGTQLWAVELGTPVKSNPTIDEQPINDHWGLLLSTLVIDAQAGLMCACAGTSLDGSPGTGRLFLPTIGLRGRWSRKSAAEPRGYFLSSRTRAAGSPLPIHRKEATGSASAGQRNAIHRLRHRG